MSKRGSSLTKIYNLVLENKFIGQKIIQFKNEKYLVLSVEKGKHKSMFKCEKFYDQSQILDVSVFRKEVEYLECIEPVGV